MVTFTTGWRYIHTPKYNKHTHKLGLFHAYIAGESLRMRASVPAPRLTECEYQPHPRFRADHWCSPGAACKIPGLGIPGRQAKPAVALAKKKRKKTRNNHAHKKDDTTVWDYELRYPDTYWRNGGELREQALVRARKLIRNRDSDAHLCSAVKSRRPSERTRQRREMCALKKQVNTGRSACYEFNAANSPSDCQAANAWNGAMGTKSRTLRLLPPTSQDTARR